MFRELVVTLSDFVVLPLANDASDDLTGNAEATVIALGAKNDIKTCSFWLMTFG